MFSYDHGLYTALSKLRLELAKEANLPAFTVFSNRTLIHMTQSLPKTTEALLQIHGVGPAKLEKYGQLFIDAITQYCSENKIEEQSDSLDVKILEEVRVEVGNIVKSLLHLSHRLGVNLAG